MAESNGATAVPYDNAFPDLANGSSAANQAKSKKPSMFARNSKMSLISKPVANKNKKGGQQQTGGQGGITKTVTIPFAERKVGTNHTGIAEIRKNCGDISRTTNTRINYSINKDDSIHVIVQGKSPAAVAQACAQIKLKLSQQGNQEVKIPKQFHRFILGKSGQKLREIEEKTGTKIRIPGPQDENDMISITGSKDAMQEARESILNIVGKQKNKGNEKMEVPKEFHAFVRGKKDAILARYDKMVNINIPPREKETNEISITGEKEKVMKIKQEISEYVNRKQAKVTEVSVDIPCEQHRYIIGPKGSGITEIFQRHDVVVDVPKQEDKSQTITLRGEPQHLGPALNEVYLKANSYSSNVLKAPVWCRPMLIGKSGANIKDFSQKFPTVKIDIAKDSDEIEVSGPLEAVDEAAKKLNMMIKNILTNFTVKEIQVPQSHHGRIIGAKGANIKKYQERYAGLNIRLPGSSEKSNSIKIEGKPEDVAAVYKEIAEQAAVYENEAQETVNFEQKYHKFFFMKDDLKNKNAKDRISLIREKYPTSLSIQFPDKEKKENGIKVRGPKQFVAASIKEMKALYEQIVAENYCGSVLVMKSFHRVIIGKGGANIKKLKDEFDVQIDIPDSGSDSQLIKITGVKANVEKARQRIRKLESDQNNIAEVTIKISQKVHPQLIGKKGAQINDIREQFGVIIQFPEKDDKSDNVIIRGPEDSVAAAKAKLSELAQIKIEEGYTESVECQPEHVKFMIGKGGETKNKLQDKFNVTLVVPTKDSTDKCITVLGRQENVKKAVKEIKERLEVLKKTKEITVQVPKKYHVQFVRRGKNGNILSSLQDDFAGTQIKVPPQGSDDETFTINGPAECVDPVAKKINEFVERFENTETITFELPCKNEDVRSLIGTGGSIINPIQDKHDVEIKIEKSAENNEEGNGAPTCTITGHKDKLECAKSELLSFAPETKEYEMPNEYHGLLLGQKGQGIRDLCEELQITIKVPKRDEKLDIITLKGTTENLNNAIKRLDEKKQEYSANANDRYLKSYTLEIDIPVDFHSKLIGVGGEQISQFRDAHGVNIQMPDRKQGGETIKIIGYEANAEAAAKAIDEFCQNLMAHVSKDVTIDNSVHRRIIGQRGRGVRKLMSDHDVEIKFPREKDADYDKKKDVVTVSGTPGNVDQAIEALTHLEEEFLQELGEDDVYDSRYKPKVAGQEAIRDQEKFQERKNRPAGSGAAKPKGKFSITDAPWSQPGNGDGQAQDSFPSLGGGGSAGDAGKLGAWAGRF